MEILYWLSQGKTNSEIALILGSNFRTVKKALRAHAQKLGGGESGLCLYKGAEILRGNII